MIFLVDLTCGKISNLFHPTKIATMNPNYNYVPWCRSGF